MIKMRVTILGGASFIGYWVKEGFRERIPNSIFQVIDERREGTCLVKRYKEEFLPINNLNIKSIVKFSPQVIVINLYDLLSYNSLAFSVNNNNALINSINLLMEVAKEFKCTLFLLQNKNLYAEETLKEGKNNYYHTYNTYNSFYYEYIITYSKVYEIPTKVFLLPNIFGLYESPESVISSLILNILQKKTVHLSNAKRDFLYIKRVVPEMLLLESQTPGISIVSFTSGKLTDIKTLYNIISHHFGRSLNIKKIIDNVILADLDKSEKVICKEVQTNISQDLRNHLEFLFKNISF